MPIDGLVLFALVAMAFAAGIVQGIVGFGSGLLILPLLAIVAPTSLPGSLVILSLSLTSAMVWLERSDLNGRNALRGVLGRTVGTVLGGIILVATPLDLLSLIFGVAILFTVLVTALSGLAPMIQGRIVTAGVVTGVMGTVAGIGGPVLAMAYEPGSAREMRSTLAFIFMLGNVMSLGVLLYVGRLPNESWKFAGLLIVPLGLGLALAQRINVRVHDSQVRGLVLVVSAVAGIGVIVNAISHL